MTEAVWREPLHEEAAGKNSVLHSLRAVEVFQEAHGLDRAAVHGIMCRPLAHTAFELGGDKQPNAAVRRSHDEVDLFGSRHSGYAEVDAPQRVSQTVMSVIVHSQDLNSQRIILGAVLSAESTHRFMDNRDARLTALDKTMTLYAASAWKSWVAIM